jgi:PAS domain S-box-containing protein
MENTATDRKKEIKCISSRALGLQLKNMRRNLQELEKGRLKLEKERLIYEKQLDSAPDAILFVDRQGKILRANAQLENVFHYTPGELDGQNIEVLIPSRFREKHKKHLQHFFANPRQRPMGTQFEIYGLRKDGEEFPADISLSHLQIDGILYASASVRDITERKALDEKLTRDYHIQRVTSEVLKISLKPGSLREQLGSILELILSVPVLFLERRGAIYLVNADRRSLALAALRGFDQFEEMPCREIIVGRCLCGEAASRCKTVYADQLDDRHRLIHDDMFSHGHYCVPIIENDECVGLLNLYVKEGHIRNGAEEKFITVIADTIALVIRHHRNEEENLRLQQQLADEGKMAAMGRMAANFAHQIRNPLTAVGGLARRLAGLEIGAKGLKYAASISAEASRLELVLNNMLSYAQPPPMKLERQSIIEAVDECLQGFSRTVKELSVEVQKDYQPVPELRFDRKQFCLALENLLANALEAMPDGGRLTLTIAREGGEKKNRVSVEVRDSGPGMPSDVLQTIFEPFYTTKVGDKKVGLGLATAKKIIEDHQGTIEVVSRPGIGTVVTLILPVADE